MNAITTNGDIAPFSQVHLDSTEKQAFQSMVDWLVHRQVRQYERFLMCINPFQDTNEWKRVARASNMTVYHEVPLSPSSSLANDRTCSRSTVMPEFLAVGTIPGTVEDALYGLMTPTTVALKRRNDLFPDRVVDGAVLATVEEPTHEKPLTCTTINWSVKALTHPLCVLTKRRDFVYLDATGFTTTSTGERIGFHLKHSIRLQTCGESTLESPIVRAKLSLCAVFRQDTNSCMQLFVGAHVDPMQKWTGMFQRWVVREVSKCLMAYSHAPVCGRVKQLACFLRGHGRSVLGDDAGSGYTHGYCWSCGSKASCFDQLNECGLCGEVVCLACSSKRRFSVLNGRKRHFEFRNQTFCAYCNRKIRRINAVAMAREEIRFALVSQALLHKHQQPEISATRSSSSG